MTHLTSPLSRTSNITLERNIKTYFLINEYKSYDIDVSPYFKELENISVYKCNETGYRFYYPLSLSGDSKFYEHFQKYDWYYMPWKWEHEVTKEYLHDGLSVLEIGCAHGAFIQRITEETDLRRVVGLELNETTVNRTDKWEIKNETIQTFSESNRESFDLVCSFQVLEHISDVYSFLNATIECLRPGGTLIISVPNNDSFIKSSDNCLNMPPHHMGLWNESSLKALTHIFPLDVMNIHIEELQEYHLMNYVHSKHYTHYPPLLGKIIRKLHKFTGIYSLRVNNASKRRQSIVGHTILVSYKKR